MRALPIVLLCLVAGRATGADMDNGTPNPAVRARTAFTVGMQALADEQPERALELFLEATRLAPDWGLAFLQAGVTQERIEPGNARAITLLERAVALEPNNPRGHHHLGLVYESAGKGADAARQFRAAIALRADLIEAQFHLGNVLSNLGRPVDALEAYRAVLARDIEHVGALMAVAVLYEVRGELREAEEALISVTRVNPTLAYHRYQLAQFYERTGDTHKAQRVYAQLEQIDPRPKRKMRQLK